MKHVLVTGGAGYIGSQACKLLARQGYVPVTFDSLVTGWASAVKFGPFVQGDLLDRDALDAAFAKYEPVAVMHFAAVSQVGEATREPGRYWRNNVLGSLNLVEAMVEAGCKRMVFSSTCATYSDQDGVVLDEQSAQMPLNAYGASKRAVEEILRDFGVSHGLEAVMFRYFNVAGADVETEVGEWHQPETRLIPVMIEAAAGKRDALTNYGTDYPTPDGTCVRDYVHVMDLVDAHIKGLEWLLEGKGSRVFNLGTGTLEHRYDEGTTSCRGKVFGVLQVQIGQLRRSNKVNPEVLGIKIIKRFKHKFRTLLRQAGPQGTPHNARRQGRLRPPTGRVCLEAMLPQIAPYQIYQAFLRCCNTPFAISRKCDPLAF